MENRSGYIRKNRYGQELKKRTFEFPIELLTELQNTCRRLKQPEVEFVIEAIKEKLSGYRV